MWATGNGGDYNDYCNCDGYITSIYTISIGAVNDQGKSPWYAEPCPSTLAVTFSSGRKGEKNVNKKIATTDLQGSCTKSHTGTSAAAPLAAGERRLTSGGFLETQCSYFSNRSCDLCNFRIFNTSLGRFSSYVDSQLKIKVYSIIIKEHQCIQLIQFSFASKLKFFLV